MPRRRRALFLSVKQTGVTLGGLAAGAILPHLAARYGWRDAVGVAIAVLFCGALAGVWVSRREASGWFELPSARAPEPRSAPVTVSIPGGGLTALFGFLMSGVQLSLAGYLTVYLVDTRGFEHHRRAGAERRLRHEPTGSPDAYVRSFASGTVCLPVYFRIQRP